MPWEALEACQCTRQPGRTLYLNTIAALHNGLAVPWLDSRPIGMPSERMKPTYVILWLKAGTVGSLEKLMLAQCQVLAQPLRLCPPVGCDLGGLLPQGQATARGLPLGLGAGVQLRRRLA